MTITLTAAVVAAIILVAWWGHRVTRHRKQTHVADLARLGVELAIAERTGDIATADQIRAEMKARGVASIEIIDLDEQEET